MIEDPLKSRVSEDAYHIAVWLRSLADEMLAHSCCPYCIINATQALESIGELEATLQRLGIPDPRDVHKAHGIEAVRSKDPWRNAASEEH